MSKKPAGDPGKTDCNTVVIKKQEQRFRNFACVLYPESAPDDWFEILSSYCIPGFISPLHEFDTNPDGEPKKPHWHILLAFDGAKSRDQVKTLFESFGGVGCDIVQSLRGYARYLCHLDNPEKYQYPVEAVRTLAGADYLDAIGLPTDNLKMVKEMQAWCNETGCVVFADLLDYAAENRSDWHRCLVFSCALVMKTYMQSRQWQVQNQGRLQN